MQASDWELLAAWLRSEVLPADLSLEQLTERTLEWLRTQGLNAPGATSLQKLLRTLKPMHLRPTC
jgi:hypothetical protein